MRSQSRRMGVNFLFRTFYALAFLLVAAWSAAADDATVTTIMLAARPELPDPNFKDAAIVVMNNIGPAPVGVIVNKPTPIDVSQLFPDVPGLSEGHDKVYFGGPVALWTVSFLFRADAPPEHGVRVLDRLYFSMDLELLRQLLGRDKPMEGLRIFIGYSGWGPGQLEAEIARGDWTMSPANAGAILDPKPEHPWPEPPASEGRRI